jgi:REP element-mobilizing transposase RayT
VTTPETAVIIVTVCTFDRACLFGNVRQGEMVLNGYGQVAQDEWRRSADLRAELTLDAFVVMPNHIHGIVFIDGQEGDPPVKGDPPVALSRQTRNGMATELS